MANEREKFEAWTHSENSGLPSGNYSESEWERLWLSYQAGWRAHADSVGPPRDEHKPIDPNQDAVIARTYVSVPKDMLCHKCGSKEPWKDDVNAITIPKADSVGPTKSPTPTSQTPCAEPEQPMSEQKCKDCNEGKPLWLDERTGIIGHENTHGEHLVNCVRVLRWQAARAGMGDSIRRNVLAEVARRLTNGLLEIGDGAPLTDRDKAYEVLNWCIAEARIEATTLRPETGVKG